MPIAKSKNGVHSAHLYGNNHIQLHLTHSKHVHTRAKKQC